AAQQKASIQPRLDLPIDTYHILGLVDIIQYYKYNFWCHEPNRRRATPRRSVDDRPDAGRARREIGRIASDDQATRARPRSSSREACYAPEAPTCPRVRRRRVHCRGKRQWARVETQNASRRSP